MKYYYNVLQGSDEWHQLRLGVTTASNINKIVTPTGKPAKNQAMRDYACEIAAQRITQCNEDNFQSFDMVRGQIQEGIARDVYSENYATVNECGFIVNGLLGCSPDGLVGEDGGIEIKSRLAKFQVRTILAEEVPAEYINQIQAFLIVTERKWCDFVQYSNGMPLFVKRVSPDHDRMSAITAALVEFEDEIGDIIGQYNERSATMVQTERVDYLGEDITIGVDE